MANKNSNIIEMSFKKNELDLLYRIKRRCKYTCESGWLKEAAYEKLEREEHPELFMDYLNQPIKEKTNLPINQNGLENMLSMFD
jgi:hypothetical protein